MYSFLSVRVDIHMSMRCVQCMHVVCVEPRDVCFLSGFPLLFEIGSFSELGLFDLARLADW